MESCPPSMVLDASHGRLNPEVNMAVCNYVGLINLYRAGMKGCYSNGYSASLFVGAVYCLVQYIIFFT